MCNKSHVLFRLLEQALAPARAWTLVMGIQIQEHLHPGAARGGQGWPGAEESF